MPDRYIDQFEISIYGPYAVRQVTSHVLGLLPPFDESLTFLCAELEGATRIVGEAVAQSRQVDAKLREGTTAKQPALATARDTLIRFRSHLASHPRGALLQRRFFVADGTATGAVRGGVRKVIGALGHIHDELTKADSGVKHAADWLHEIGAARDALAPAVAHIDAARTSRRAMTPAVEQARAGWLLRYQATKSVVETVLRLIDKLELLPQIFSDLAVVERGISGSTPTPPAPDAPTVLPAAKVA